MLPSSGSSCVRHHAIAFLPQVHLPSFLYLVQDGENQIRIERWR
uniref:Uncharacterized protein n=1 Tax=Triticum urartu TaxID=4572 RepID=A0A8R7PCU4_TRIUA